MLGAPTGADAYIFWSSYDSGQSTVGRAGLDASGVNGALVTDIYYGGGVATDGTHVYWGESGSNPKQASIGRATVDGEGVDRAFQAPGTFCGVFGLRATASDLYWLESTCANRAIYRASNAGGQGYNQLGSASDICGFDIDANYVYWSESHYIARTPNSTTPQPIEHTWLDVGSGFAACAVAVNGSHVYWTNQAPATDFRGTSIGRAALSGDPKSVEPEFLVGTTFFTGSSSPSGLAVAGDFIYWTNQPPSGGVTGSIGRANLDGTGVDYTFVDNVFDPFSLDVDSQGPAPASASNTPKPTRPPPRPPRIVSVSTSNRSWAPTGSSTQTRARPASISKKKVPRGTVFAYTLDQGAAVTIDVRKAKAGRLARGKCKKPKRSNRNKKRCDLTAHRLFRAGRAGKNRVPYTGRVKGKALRPGRYRAVFTATGEGGKSKSASVAFRILRP
jgi:hypothetical protein